MPASESGVGGSGGDACVGLSRCCTLCVLPGSTFPASSDDSLKAQVELKKRSRQGGVEVNKICIPDFTLTLLYSEEEE